MWDVVILSDLSIVIGGPLCLIMSLVELDYKEFVKALLWFSLFILWVRYMVYQIRKGRVKVERRRRSN